MNKLNKEKYLDTKSYFLILKEIKNGNKTSTSIAKKLKISQPSIYESLIKLQEKKLIKKDFNNWELDAKETICGCCSQIVRID